MSHDEGHLLGKYTVRSTSAKAPWASLTAAARAAVSLARVRAAFAVPPVSRAPVPALLRPAAVLVPIFEDAAGVRVVLLRRSAHVGTHRGDIAFPGGVLDPGETSVEAAVREAEEELGIPRGVVDVIGELRHVPATDTGFHITPVVAVLKAVPRYVLSVREVDDAFDVSFNELLDPARYRQQLWQRPGRSAAVVEYFDLEKGTAWGATAGVLTDLLTLVLATPEPHVGRSR